MFLLDINILIALADGDHVHHVHHVHHDSAVVFFKQAMAHGWATCPLTENGFLRIMGHPRYDQGPGSPQEARYLISSLCTVPGHQFWPDSISLCDSSQFPTLPGSRHLTDYYLLALAIRHGAKLASFDQRIDPSHLEGGASAYHVIHTA